MTEVYKDDVENIDKWKAVYKIFNEKFFTSVKDCTKDKVELYVKEREYHKVFLKFIITEGRRLKKERPEAILELAKVLERNPEKRAEIRFMFFFLQAEQLMDNSDTRNFNSVLDIATLFTKKNSNQKMFVELKRQYSMIISNSVPSKSQKTSVNQNYAVEALIEKMKDDLNQSEESYENHTFYNKKHKSMIDLMKKLKQKLKISEKQIQILESGCKDKSLFVPYGMGFSPLLESVERDAREFGWVTPAPEQINELKQVQLKPPGDNSDSDGDDDDGDDDGDSDGDDDDGDDGDSDGDDEEFPNIGDEHERDQINVAIYDQEKQSRIKQQEEEDEAVAKAVLDRESKNWGRYGSSSGSESDEEFDGGF